MTHMFLQDMSHQLREDILLATSAIDHTSEEIRQWKEWDDLEGRNESVRHL